ncbi:MAG: DUF6875 domain-containing protein [Candidatus Parabeggiatoa sp.]|nr:hypothetical protein [Candidatus Parabeggiatoa sp.]
MEKKPEKRVIYLGRWKEEALADKGAEKRFAWLIQHLTSSQGVGKKHPTCPWSEPAIAEGRFFIGDARHFDIDIDSICYIVEDMAKVYKNYAPFIPPEKHPPTLTVLLPYALSGETIVDVLEIYRPKLTPVGIMLGALDPINKLRSLTGGVGYPYQAPWNFFTIRWMVPGDYIFLNLNPVYKDIYIKFFGSWPEDN